MIDTLTVNEMEEIWQFSSQLLKKLVVNGSQSSSFCIYFPSTYIFYRLFLYLFIYLFCFNVFWMVVWRGCAQYSRWAQIKEEA